MTIAIVLLFWTLPFSQPHGPTRTVTVLSDCECAQSAISFDISSLEKIILEPEAILQDPEGFWQEDEAYRLVRKWHDRISQPPDLERWRAQMADHCKLSTAERESHSSLAAARRLATIESKFAEDAVTHLCSFLPPDADLTTTINFTTDIMASGFQMDGKIVMHIVNHDLLNMFVHEVFHRGFASTYKKYVTAEIETNPLPLMYLSLQNEGMATYSAYMAVEQFPQVGQVGRDDVATDYDLLGKPDEVLRLLGRLNQLLREADSLSSDELRTKSWQLGVRERAYYVVGAYMAQQIDRKIGRQALIETIKNSPPSFVTAYNSICEPDLRLVEPD